MIAGFIAIAIIMQTHYRPDVGIVKVSVPVFEQRFQIMEALRQFDLGVGPSFSVVFA